MTTFVLSFVLMVLVMLLEYHYKDVDGIVYEAFWMGFCLGFARLHPALAMQMSAIALVGAIVVPLFHARKLRI